jgi:hypothetical protein
MDFGTDDQLREDDELDIAETGLDVNPFTDPPASLARSPIPVTMVIVYMVQVATLS